MDVSTAQCIDLDTVFDTPNSQNRKQPDIEEGNELDESEGDEEDMEFQVSMQEREEEKIMTEEELREIQKGDSIRILGELRMKPEDLFRMYIPLCRLVAMPMVRPALASDVGKLEQDFTGYRDGAAVFYDFHHKRARSDRGVLGARSGKLGSSLEGEESGVL